MRSAHLIAHAEPKPPGLAHAAWQTGHQYNLRADSSCIRTGVWQMRHGRPARRYT